MRSSSTCHSAAGLALVALLLLGAAAPARALDPASALSQYLRDQWGPDKGFPGGPVHAIAQTDDGYLWIAADKGLVRFDGLTFTLLIPAGQEAGTGPTVLGLAADGDRGLWARLRGPALVRYRRGAFEHVSVTGQSQEMVVTAMQRTPDGDVLLAPLDQGLFALRGGRLQPIVPAASIRPSFVLAITRTPTGEVWLGTRDAGLLRVRDRVVTPVSEGLPDPKVNCLLPGAGGEVWIGTDRGIARWTGSAVTTAGLPAALVGLPTLGMLRDRDGNVWIAAEGRGLLRVSGARVAGMEPWDTGARGNVTAVFEDRDGNLWVGTSRGIERWRDGAFTTFTRTQGLPADHLGPVHADAAGRVWFAPASGGLYWLHDGQVGAVTGGGLAADVVYSIGGAGDDLWVGRQRGGLSRVRAAGAGFIVDSVTQAGGLAQNSVYAVHRARDGAVWAGTLSAGVSRVTPQGVTTWTTADGLASNTIAAMLETRDGAMWFGTPNGVSVVSKASWRRYVVADGLPANEVNALLEDSTGAVWVGTTHGLALVRAGRAAPVAAIAELRAPVLGLAEDPRGGLWIATAERLFRVDRARLAAGTAVADRDVREYGLADGLMSTEGLERHRTLVTDPGGRLWFATRHGLSAIDVRRAIGRTLPALTHIERLAADAASVDVEGPARIPAGALRVTVSFTGLSLAAPDRVRYRYRLDGFDRGGWSEPVPARQAVYTNLAPGPYEFRVTASNSEGAWGGPEARLRFEVAPAWWQTTAFRLAVVALAAFLTWGLYWLRVRQVARRIQGRFDERLAERMRIAQELHDTLLQGFVSASMQLHVAAERVPADSPAKAPLGRVLELMRQVIDEGRHAVRGLRSPAAAIDTDLEQAFARIRGELAVDEHVGFRVIVEGQPRPLNPMVRDDVYRIGREALVNAFRHSGASAVEVSLEFAPRHFRLVVRDDGRGIDEEVLRRGREGHWGLLGMRERADRIGARFELWSRAGAGAEMALVVPHHVAFQPQADGRRGWWSRWRA